MKVPCHGGHALTAARGRRTKPRVRVARETRPVRARDAANVDARLAWRPPQQAAGSRSTVGIQISCDLLRYRRRPLLRQTTQNAQARVSLSATTIAKRAKPQ